MALADIIMENALAQSRRTNVLTENLSQLGQQIGQQLAVQEYQKQAQAQLPVLQQQMKDAIAAAGAGRSAEAYSKMIGLTANPQVLQNPFMLPALEMGFKAIGDVDQSYRSMEWKRFQERGAGGGTTGIPAARIPTTEEVIAGGFKDQSVNQGVDQADGGGSLEAQSEGIDSQNEQELMAMRQEGQVGFGFGNVSKYIPPKEIVDNTVNAVNEYDSLDQPSKQDFITQIAETDVEAPEEGEEMEILGVGFGRIIGPKRAPAPEGKEIVSEESGYRDGVFAKKVLERPKQKTAEEIAREDAEQKTFDGWVQNYNTAKQMVRTNPQLRDIFEKAGGDITRIGINQIDETTVQASIDGQPIGELSVAAPSGMMSEAMAVNMIIKAPAMLGKGKGKYQFYKVEPTQAPPAPAAGEAAPAPAAPTPAPTPLAETAGLEKMLGELTATETAQTKQQRTKEIEKINKEISALSGTERTVSGPSVMGAKGAEARRPKTKKEIENAIIRIKELVAKRDALTAINEGRAPTAPQQTQFVEGKIYKQGNKRYRYTNGEFVEIQ